MLDVVDPKGWKGRDPEHADSFTHRLNNRRNPADYPNRKACDMFALNPSRLVALQDDSAVRRLASMNDAGLSFGRIANELEAAFKSALKKEVK
jgi:hypothetical protein